MKITGFKIISLVVLILATYLGIKTYLTYKNNYNIKREEVIESAIEYDAKRCYIKGECEGTITVNDLYDKGYITYEYTSPTTGKPFNKNLEIQYDDEKEEATLLILNDTSQVSILNHIKMWLH